MKNSVYKGQSQHYFYAAPNNGLQATWQGGEGRRLYAFGNFRVEW
jgi:hypothetical protein